jgi:hypothetical protein
VWAIEFNKDMSREKPFDTLHVVAWAESFLGEDIFLGEVNVDLTSLPHDVVIDQWFPLQPYSGTNFAAKIPAGALAKEERGEVRLILYFDPAEESLLDKSKVTIANTLDKTIATVRTWLK